MSVILAGLYILQNTMVSGGGGEKGGGGKKKKMGGGGKKILHTEDTESFDQCQ